MRDTGRSGEDRDRNGLRLALRSLRTMFVAVALFSAAINVLMLTGPLFMIQVYDRVLASRSGSTLVALSVLAATLYLFLGLFEHVRNRVTSRAGHWLDRRLGPTLFRQWLARGAAGVSEGGRPLGDLALVRQFLGSPALMALFDAPWVPFYLGVLFLMHWQLGLLALGGAAVSVTLAVANEMTVRRATARAMQIEAVESRFLEQAHRNAGAILPMGMIGAVTEQWQRLHGEAAGNGQRASESGEVFSTASKAFRMLLQSAMLGLGAWLSIRQEISPGMIIAATVTAGRALAPVDQTIGQWRTIGRARLAHRRLEAATAAAGSEEKRLRLPDPVGRLQLRGVTRYTGAADATTGARRAILHQVSFDLEPGDGLGVIGPSASGKTTLARVLVGAWAADAGTVRIDGAAIDHWDLEALGRWIGYLPQTVEFLAGTIHQNIARFDPRARDEDIVEAARIAGVHDMILRLPDGYETRIGFGGSHLSGGQIQRIALARALYRQPRLIVLDEPNSNLDVDGDAALTRAIERMRAAGSVVVVMAHRPSAIAAVDKLLMLNGGAVVDFGDKAEVLRRVTRGAETEEARA